MKKINHLKIGIRTIKIEAKGLDKLAETMGNEFNNVCNNTSFFDLINS